MAINDVRYLTMTCVGSVLGACLRRTLPPLAKKRYGVEKAKPRNGSGYMDKTKRRNRPERCEPYIYELYTTYLGRYLPPTYEMETSRAKKSHPIRRKGMGSHTKAHAQAMDRLAEDTYGLL